MTTAVSSTPITCRPDLEHAQSDEAETIRGLQTVMVDMAKKVAEATVHWARRTARAAW